MDNENLSNVENAVDFIARLRQASDFSEVPVGSNVCSTKLGGGINDLAIDAESISVQSKLLGAEGYRSSL